MTMLHSLRLRLVLALVLVALIPVVTVAVLIDRATADAFHEYLNARAVSDAQNVAAQVGEVTDARVVVVDPSNQVLADSGAIQVSEDGETASMSASSSYGALRAGNDVAGADPGTTSGAVAVVEAGGFGADAAPEGGDEAGSVVVSLPEVPDESFFGDVTRALLIAVGLAAAAAVLLALLLARQIVRPVERLTIAAQGMAAGDLRQRVTVRSKNEIGVLAGAFNTMAESRSRLEGLRRNMINDVAHELRTPLGNLQGYLELLRDGLTAPTPEVLGLLHEESLSLNRLVADLQELALAEAGQLPLKPEPLDLAEPVLGAIEAFKPRAGAHQIALSVNLPDGLPAVVADRARLGQILRNLLNNAIVHTPPAGAITISAEPAGDVVRVTVRDSGRGIPPEHLPHIFDRFYRADPARSRTTGGAGLGLAIVKHLVEAHGGAISAASVVGSGTVFAFTLPRVAAGAESVGG